MEPNHYKELLSGTHKSNYGDMYVSEILPVFDGIVRCLDWEVKLTSLTKVPGIIKLMYNKLFSVFISVQHAKKNTVCEI